MAGALTPHDVQVNRLGMFVLHVGQSVPTATFPAQPAPKQGWVKAPVTSRVNVDFSPQFGHAAVAFAGMGSPSISTAASTAARVRTRAWSPSIR